MGERDDSDGLGGPAGPPASGVKSVEKALRILEVLAEGQGQIGVNEIGRTLGINKATVSRILATLARFGFVERDRATDRYRLGLAYLRAGTAAVASLGFVERARPALARLVEATGETVTLSVLDRDVALNVEQATPAHRVVTMNWVGMRTPLHCSSDGKVLLAGMDDAGLGRFFEEDGLEALTSRTVVDPAELRAQIDQVRGLGYAVALEELEEGLNGTAAPVRVAGGAVVAALTVSGPAHRLTPERVGELALVTREAAVRLSAELGYSPARVLPAGRARPPTLTLP